jgi:hypothetical protein
MVGATATVSTLVTVVGQPNTPTSAGNGGFSLDTHKRTSTKNFNFLHKNQLPIASMPEVETTEFFSLYLAYFLSLIQA